MKFTTINEKIKEREKLTDFISKSFIDEKQKSKEKFVMTIENQSLYNECKDHVYSRAKIKNNNFESNTRNKSEVSNVDTRSKRVDEYYSKYVE